MSGQSRGLKRKFDDDGNGSSSKTEHVVSDEPLYECPVCSGSLAGPEEPHGICASTKCGHLFGRSCILRWFTINSESRSCPICLGRMDGGMSDVVPIYGLTKKTEGTSRVENSDNYRQLYETTLAELESIKRANEKLRREATQARNNSRYNSDMAHRSTAAVMSNYNRLYNWNMSDDEGEFDPATFMMVPAHSNSPRRIQLPRAVEYDFDIMNTDKFPHSSITDAGYKNETMVTACKLEDQFGLDFLCCGIHTKVPLSNRKISSFEISPFSRSRVIVLVSGGAERKFWVISFTTETKAVQIMATFELSRKPTSMTWMTVEKFYVGTSRGELFKGMINESELSPASLNTTGDNSPIICLQRVNDYSVIGFQLGTLRFYSENEETSYISSYPGRTVVSLRMIEKYNRCIAITHDGTGDCIVESYDKKSNDGDRKFIRTTSRTIQNTKLNSRVSMDYFINRIHGNGILSRTKYQLWTFMFDEESHHIIMFCCDTGSVKKIQFDENKKILKIVRNMDYDEISSTRAELKFLVVTDKLVLTKNLKTKAATSLT
uniref:RING-type domain-containing protein n=1 Tax=Rhabditophanes sp. KR3021 TaxID=114890 RepID=A0AC35TWT5_9BILA